MGFPPALDPHSPAEPQGTLPVTPGKHRGPGSSQTLIPDLTASPGRSLACSEQSSPAKKAPVPVGEFRDTQNRRIYTSTMTVPLPLLLPTGWDFNHRFSSQAGGCARGMWLKTCRAHPAGTQQHPPRRHQHPPKGCSRGKLSLQVPRTRARGSGGLQRLRGICSNLRYFPNNRFKLGHFGLQPPTS